MRVADGAGSRKRCAKAAALLLAGAATVSAAPPPRLSADGWGPLRIGMTRAQVERLAGRDSRPDAVGGPDIAVCHEFRPRRAPPGLRVMVERGRLTRVSIARRGVASDRGVRVGDAATRVRAAYRGQRLEDRPNAYVAPPARYLTWSAPRTRAPRGVRYEIGADGRVSAIHAGGAAIRHVEGCV